MVQLVKKETESTKMGKSKKSKTSAGEAPISPVIAKQNKKVKKNKNLETAAKMLESEEIVQTRKSKKAAAKLNKSEEVVQTEKNKKSTSAKAKETTSPKKSKKKSIALEAAKEEETADKKSNKRKATSDGNTKKSKRSNVENTIYVQLNHNSTEKSIREAFTKFGDVASVRKPRKSGYCFVRFDGEECVKKAIAGKEDMKVDNQMVGVAAFCQEKTERIVDMVDSIFVAKISQNTTKQDIEEYFAKFGAVKKVSLPLSRNKEYNHKGFAIILFEDKSGVDATLAQSEHKIKSKAVVVKPALDKKTIKKIKKETDKQTMKESGKEEGSEGEEDDNEDHNKTEED